MSDIDLAETYLFTARAFEDAASMLAADPSMPAPEYLVSYAKAMRHAAGEAVS